MKRAHSSFASLFVFSPTMSHEGNLENFEEFMNYFRSKNFAGVVQSEIYSFVIYIMPRSEQTDQIYQLKERELLGIYVSHIKIQQEGITDIR